MESDKLRRIKRIVKANDNVVSAVKEMITEHLIVTNSEGRRLYNQLKSIKYKSSI